MTNIGRRIQRWLARTPVQTFILCPLAVAAFEAMLHGGRLTIVPRGAPLLAWGYLQYLLVARYRLPRANGSAGMEVPPERIITTGPYHYTRNPMYLGHLIFLAGLAILFWSPSPSSCSCCALPGFIAACCAMRRASKKFSASRMSLTGGG